MPEMLDLPDFFYAEGVKLFIFELSAFITKESIEIDKGNCPQEDLKSKYEELACGMNLSTQLSNDYTDIVNGEKTIYEINKRVFNAVLDNLYNIQQQTNSEEEMLAIIDKRIEEARKVVDAVRES